MTAQSLQQLEMERCESLIWNMLESQEELHQRQHLPQREEEVDKIAYTMAYDTSAMEIRTVASTVATAIA
jgi:hypothetical protein